MKFLRFFDVIIPLCSIFFKKYVQDVSSREPSRTRALYAEFVGSMETEFNFWLNRFRNVTVSNGLDSMGV